MSSFGTIPLQDIWAMLNVCAPGHTKRERDHNWMVTWPHGTYPRLPLGKHGKRQNPRIEIGHVRNMVRMLNLDPEEASRCIPQLGMPADPTVTLNGIRVVAASATQLTCETQNGSRFTVEKRHLESASSAQREGDTGTIIVPRFVARRAKLA